VLAEGRARALQASLPMPAARGCPATPRFPPRHGAGGWGGLLLAPHSTEPEDAGPWLRCMNLPEADNKKKKRGKEAASVSVPPASPSLRWRPQLRARLPSGPPTPTPREAFAPRPWEVARGWGGYRLF